MQNYFTLYTLFIKGDTKFWLVVLDKYKKLQTRHKGLTLILKYKSALCVSLRYEYQIPKGFWFPFARKTDKFPVDEPLPIRVSFLHPICPPLLPDTCTSKQSGVAQLLWGSSAAELWTAGGRGPFAERDLTLANLVNCDRRPLVKRS